MTVLPPFLSKGFQGSGAPAASGAGFSIAQLINTGTNALPKPMQNTALPPAFSVGGSTGAFGLPALPVPAASVSGAAAMDPFFKLMKMIPGNPFGESLPAAASPAAISPPASNAIPRGGNLNTPGNPLRQSLDQIESDPEGARLIAEARAKGVWIEVGDPSQALGSLGAADQVISCNCPQHQQAALDGNTVVHGATIQNGNNIKIVVRDPGNVKTIVHELVHAISGRDGNSREEEGIADVLGSRIANRTGTGGGLRGSEQQIFQNKQRFYPGLNQSNGIRQTLASLGLNVNV